MLTQGRILAVLTFIIFLICIKKFLKSAKEPESRWRKLLLKLNWWKLSFEFCLINFFFYISIRKFGLFGLDLTETLEIKKNVWFGEMLIFITLPAIFVIIMLAISIIMKKSPYSHEEGKYRKLIYCFLFNKFYALIVIANVLSKFINTG